MLRLLNNIQFFQIGENAISLEFGGSINEETLSSIGRLNEYIKKHPFAGLLSTIPAYTTLTLYFDPVGLMNDRNIEAATCLDKITCYIKSIQVTTNTDEETDSPIIQIPVCYDPIFGFDLQELSSFYQLTKEEIIELHSSTVYTVYMIGFVPGFPYLGGLSPKLTAPRKQNPRASIPAGSVGIAGQQTGIYPLETPGGWQIIGRTPLTLFNVTTQPPSLLKAGDKIKFEAISFNDFEQLQKVQ